MKKTHKKVKYRLEQIEWIDSAGYTGWHNPGDCTPQICVSVGYISAETKHAITITSHIQYDPRMHHADMIIPKIVIQKRTRIKG